jgi:hypothetical protein
MPAAAARFPDRDAELAEGLSRVAQGRRVAVPVSGAGIPGP